MSNLLIKWKISIENFLAQSEQIVGGLAQATKCCIEKSEGTDRPRFWSERKCWHVSTWLKKAFLGPWTTMIFLQWLQNRINKINYFKHIYLVNGRDLTEAFSFSLTDCMASESPIFISFLGNYVWNPWDWALYEILWIISGMKKSNWDLWGLNLQNHFEVGEAKSLDWGEEVRLKR